MMSEKCVKLPNGGDAEIRCEEFYLAVHDPITEEAQASSYALARESCMAEVHAALEHEELPDGFLDAVGHCLRENPEILGCSWGGLIRSLLGLKEMGLIPDGEEAVLMTADRCCYGLARYRGVKKYLQKKGVLEGVSTGIVREHDHFSYHPGVIRRHGYRLHGERGKVYAVYARATDADGRVKSIILAKHEIDQVMQDGTDLLDSLWEEQWEEMAKLTALRVLAEDLRLDDEVLEWSQCLRP